MPKKKEEESCLTLELLIEMTKAYNSAFEDKIELIESSNEAYYKEYLTEQLNERLSKCK